MTLNLNPQDFDLVIYHINRARVLLGDQNKEIWADDEMLAEVQAIMDEIAWEGFYRKEIQIAIREGAERYQWPEDSIRPQKLNIDHFLTGRIVVATTYASLLHVGFLPSGHSQTSASYWNFPYANSQHLSSNFYSRDTVSNDEFLIQPAFVADEAITINGEVFWGP